MAWAKLLGAIILFAIIFPKLTLFLGALIWIS